MKIIALAAALACLCISPAWADPPPAAAPPYRPGVSLQPVAIYDAQGNIVGSFGGGSTGGSVTAPGTSGTQAQAVQGITGGVPLPIQGGNSSAVKTDGSAVTQPVSAAALPLPAGAATSAKQPAFGTAGTPSADVLTIQGAATGTALPVSQPKVAAGPTTTRTTVVTGTTATAILAAGRSDEMVSLKNSGTVKLYFGGTGVTVSNGWPLAVGESMTMDAKMSSGGISAILDSGQATAGEIAVWRF